MFRVVMLDPWGHSSIEHASLSDALDTARFLSSVEPSATIEIDQVVGNRLVTKSFRDWEALRIR